MNDPYFSTDVCVDRLYKEYLNHKSLIIALDFDDTIFDYHKKGYTYNQVVNLIKECQQLGFHICIFTGTPKDKWENIYDYCEGIGIKISSINKNPINLPFGNDGKMYYNILLDDRAGLRESYEVLKKTLNKIQNNNEYSIEYRV